MNPFLSIIIPVYNKEEFLPRCLNSILVQEVERFEVILVNDGSTDASPQLCDHYARKHEKIRVIHKQNEGVAKARQDALEIAKGTYLYFVDSDDWIDKRTLKENFRIAMDLNVDIVVFGYSQIPVRNSETPPYQPALPECHLKSREEIESHLCSLLEKGIKFALWNKFFKRSLVNEFDIAFLPFQRGQDMGFTIDYFKVAESLYVNPEIYYHYEFDQQPEKYSVEVFSNHLELYHRFFSLYPEWMSRRINYRFAAKLFGFWFFYKVPKLIIGSNSREDAMSRFSLMFNEELFLKYLSGFSLMKLKSIKLYLPILILKSKSSRLIYYLLSLVSHISFRFLRKIYNPS